MASKSDFHFPRRTTPFLDCISLWSAFQPSAAIFYLFAIQEHLYKSQSWQSISFKKYKRERERQLGIGWSWCAPLKSKGRFLAFLGAATWCHTENHTLMCYQRSQVDHWPCAAFASGAQAARSCLVVAEG